MDLRMCVNLRYLTDSHSYSVGKQGREVSNISGGEITTRASCGVLARSEVE